MYKHNEPYYSRSLFVSLIAFIFNTLAYLGLVVAVALIIDALAFDGKGSVAILIWVLER